MNFSSLKQTCTRTVHRSALVVKKHSPEILTGVGIVGLVGTAVLASKATLKLDVIVDDIQFNLEKIQETEANEDISTYGPKEALHDKTVTYTRGVISIGKLYGPALSLGLASIGCILAAHGIMKKRNVALAAAYKASEEAFNKYRERVVEAIGADQESDVFKGIREEETVDESGKKKVVRVQDGQASIYRQLWDETRPTWNKDRMYNKQFLLCQQNMANDLLRTRGHLFLNEVHDMLGIERTPIGQMAGWVMGKGGDEFVDFGLDSFESPEAAAFLDGTEPAIWLDFNVDGNVMDLI